MRRFLDPGLRLAGRPRRQLLLLTTLFFTILFLEVFLGHQPSFRAGGLSFALLPVVLTPLALAALAWAQLFPGRGAESALEAAMMVMVLLGGAGFVFHLQAHGVGWSHPGRLFRADTWAADPAPTVPLSFSLAGLVGALAGWRLRDDPGCMRAGLAVPGILLWPVRLALAALFGGLALSVIPATGGAGLTLLLGAALLQTGIVGADVAAGLGLGA